MTGVEILDRFKELGVVVELIGDQVQVTPVNKVPEGLLAEAKSHKAEIVHVLRLSHSNVQPPPADKPESLERLITRLKNGHLWLLDQHRKWQSGDPDAASDEEFSMHWNRWWEMDQQLRDDYRFRGCIHAPDGTCPDGFPCRFCSDRPVPAVVAQLALGE